MTRMKTHASDVDNLAGQIERDPGVIEKEFHQLQVDRAVRLLKEAAGILRELDVEVWRS